MIYTYLFSYRVKKVKVRNWESSVSEFATEIAEYVTHWHLHPPTRQLKVQCRKRPKKQPRKQRSLLKIRFEMRNMLLPRTENVAEKTLTPQEKK